MDLDHLIQRLFRYIGLIGRVSMLQGVGSQGEEVQPWAYGVKCHSKLWQANC